MILKSFWIWLLVFSFARTTQCIDRRMNQPMARTKRSHDNVTKNTKSTESFSSLSNHNVADNTSTLIATPRNIPHCICSIQTTYNDNVTIVTEVKEDTCSVLLPIGNKDSVEWMSCQIFDLDSADIKMTILAVQNATVLDPIKEYVILPKYSIWIIIVTLIKLLILLIIAQYMTCRTFVYPTKTRNFKNKIFDNVDDESCRVNIFEDRATTPSPHFTGDYKDINTSLLYEPKVEYDRNSIKLMFRNSFTNANTRSNVNNDSDGVLKMRPISPEEIDAIVQQVLSRNLNSEHDEPTSSATGRMQLTL